VFFPFFPAQAQVQTCCDCSFAIIEMLPLFRSPFSVCVSESGTKLFKIGPKQKWSSVSEYSAAAAEQKYKTSRKKRKHHDQSIK
jgi:hypothetical protein